MSLNAATIELLFSKGLSADALGVNDKRFVPHFYFCAPEKPGRVEVRIGE